MRQYSDELLLCVFFLMIKTEDIWNCPANFRKKNLMSRIAMFQADSAQRIPARLFRTDFSKSPEFTLSAGDGKC